MAKARLPDSCLSAVPAASKYRELYRPPIVNFARCLLPVFVFTCFRASSGVVETRLRACVKVTRLQKLVHTAAAHQGDSYVTNDFKFGLSRAIFYLRKFLNQTLGKGFVIAQTLFNLCSLDGGEGYLCYF